MLTRDNIPYCPKHNLPLRRYNDGSYRCLEKDCDYVFHVKIEYRGKEISLTFSSESSIYIDPNKTTEE